MKSILKQKLISSYKKEMISFLKSNPEYFNEAIELAILDDQPFSWRAAYVLWGCMDENDIRIQKHIKSIVDSIKDKKDGHQRELLKILYRMEIKEKFEGQIFDICMNLWKQIEKSPSVRMTAIKHIFKIAKKHLELFNEIKFLMSDQYLDPLSPGVKHSIGIMMKK